MSNAEKIERLRVKAGERHQEGNLEEAVRLYQRILELHRSDTSARYGLGVIRLQQDRPAEALAVLEPLAAERPHDGNALSQCGMARQALGHPEQALVDFERALRADPNN